MRAWKCGAVFFGILMVWIVGASSHAADVLFDPLSVRKIYYLLASSQGMGRSSLGHAYLRVSKEEYPSPSDDVIEFVAQGQVSSLGEYLRALGIGEPYDRGVHIQKYSTIVQEMNFLALRDLTSYELALSSEQRARVIERINQALQAGSYGKYYFLTENCASATQEILEAAEIPVKRGISSLMPNSVPALLESSGLVGQIHVDFNLVTRRLKLFEKYAPSMSRHVPGLEKLKEQVTSGEMAARALGFSRLLTEARRDSKLIPAPVSRYLNAFLYLEPRVFRADLQALIHGGGSLETFQLPDLELGSELSRLFDSATSPRLVQKNIILEERAGFSLRYVFAYSARDNSGSKTVLKKKRFKVSLDSLSLNEKGELLWNGTLVGLRTSGKLFKNEIVAPGLHFIPSFERKGPASWGVRTDLLLDPPSVVAQRIHPANSPSWIPFRNNDPSRPSCSSLVDFQKALLKRAIFDAEARKIPENGSLGLIEELMNGKIVVVPGFPDARSWLESLSKTAVRALLYRFQMERYESLGGALSNWWESKELSTRDLMELGRIARLGHYPMIFQQVDAATGHSVLLLDVVDEGEKLRLVVYDPNFGFTRDLFYFDKRTERTQSSLYPGEKLFFRTFDIENEATQDYLLNPESAKGIVQLSRSTGIYSITPEILGALF